LEYQNVMNEMTQRRQRADTPQAEELARDDALHADLGWALGVVFRAYRRNANAVIADVPGGPRGYQVLTAAARPAPMSQAAIAQDTGLDRTVMTYLVDDLEAAGLLRRQQDPNDRRARLLVVTSDGAARLRAWEHRLAQVEQHLLQGMTTADQLSLRCLLQRLAQQVDALESNGDRCQVMTDIDANLEQERAELSSSI
jgi:DNA-binding MarR family transcriptional regulator